MSVLRDRRFILVAILTALLAAQFWGGSRYPALNEKAAMGTATPISGLAFSTLVKVDPNEKLATRILYETVNWTYTNRQGMTFGILFGALAMTLLALIPQRSVRSGFGNTLMGMAIGTPMGVCANCAAPIGKAIHAAGGSIETMLAAMLSSPTLNVIILTMLFAMFPFYMAAIKLGLTVAFILIGIPLLTRWLCAANGSAIGAPAISGGSDALGYANTLTPPGQAGLAASWPQAGWWVVRTFAVNLWFIVKTTVPLMLLAGFLGSVLIAILPLESLADALPTRGRRAVLGLMVASLIGVFLPVPMSFDVIATAVLWQAGLPVQYAMALLFTLGIFSIYPFFIVWRAISLRMATGLFLGLGVLGVVGGLLGHQYFLWDTQRQHQLFLEFFHRASASLQGPRVVRVGGGTREQGPDGELVASLQPSTLTIQPMGVTAVDGGSAERVPFAALSAPAGASGKQARLFTRFEGPQLGIDEPYSYSVLTYFHPRVVFRGVASGDVHNDGWADILLTSDSGLSLYANRQGQGFVSQRIDIPALKDFIVVNAALVDLNNDGWLDMYFATYRHGDYVIYNTQGRFTAENLHRLPGHDGTVISGAAAFGDVDRDGYLDIVLGDWIQPCRYFMPCQDRPANNYLLRSDRGQFQVQQPFPGVPGRQTLNLLLSDINGDGTLDLVIGAEDPAPDTYFFGNGNGTFRRIVRKDGVIPVTTGSTMSVASADINNDLRLAVYLGQITGLAGRPDVEAGPDACNEIVDPTHRSSCQVVMKVHQQMPTQTKTNEISRCLGIQAADYREDCIAAAGLLWALKNGPPELCDLFTDRWEEFRFMCRNAYQEAPKPDGTNPRRLKPPGPETIPITGTRNVLLAPTGDGRFADMAGEMGVQFAGFTWNAKFADLDNDEFVDLYAVNGWFPSARRESHYFYQNEQGRKFVNKTDEAGLTSFLATASYTYVDLDNDGDLDIVAVPVVGPVLIYVNNSTSNRIAFELKDHVGNRSGIGSKVVIHYGPQAQRHQMREILASGGFISFDAPIAYFGLGEFQRVERVEVHWSTGERTEYRGNFQAGSRYVLKRQRAVTAEPNQAGRSARTPASVPRRGPVRPG